MRKDTFEYFKKRLREARDKRVDLLLSKVSIPARMKEYNRLEKVVAVDRLRFRKVETRIRESVYRESRSIEERIMLHDEEGALILLRKFEKKRP